MQSVIETLQCIIECAEAIIDDSVTLVAYLQEKANDELRKRLSDTQRNFDEKSSDLHNSMQKLQKISKNRQLP